MDQQDLDALARRLARPTSRRAGLAALLGGLLGPGALTDDADATKKAKRRRKRNKRRKPPTGTSCERYGDCPISRPRCFDGQCRSACSLPLFSHGDYTGCSFPGQAIKVLRKCDQCTSYITLDRTNLSGSTISIEDLSDWSFVGADLRNATISWSGRSVIVSGDFRGANLDGATLQTPLDKRILGAAAFDGCSARNSKIHLNVQILSCVEADLTGADMRGLITTSADFSKAILDYADFSGARINWNRVVKEAASTICVVDPSGKTYDCPDS